MTEFQFNPIDGFKNATSFPNPSTETEARAQVQSLLDQARDAINSTTEQLTTDINTRATKEEVAWIVLGQITDGSLTDPKLSNDPSDIKARFTAFVNTMNELTGDLSKRLDRNSYDDYQLWLELYYKGTISHVEADNAKAIMFDGFADTVNVDTTNSDVTVDTTNKKVTLKNTDISLNSGTSNYSLNNNYPLAQTFTPTKTIKLTSVAVKLNSSVSTTAKLRIVNTDTYGVPMFSSFVVADISFSTIIDTDYYYTIIIPGGVLLESGKTYALVLSTTYNLSGGITWGCGGAYAGGSGYASDNGGSTWNVVSDFNVNFIFDFMSPSTLITDPKAIPFIPTSMKLYQSVKKPAGTTITTTISANGGTNYESPTLVSSRPDPKFAGYTEEEYDLIIANVGQAIKLKSVLTGANRDEVEIKRYGLIIS